LLPIESGDPVRFVSEDHLFGATTERSIVDGIVYVLYVEEWQLHDETYLWFLSAERTVEDFIASLSG
jgi:hypothetical protein